MAIVHQVVPGIRKAAIVMLLVGEELSSEVFKHLSEDEIEGLRQWKRALVESRNQLRFRFDEEQTCWS